MGNIEGHFFAIVLDLHHGQSIMVNLGLCESSEQANKKLIKGKYGMELGWGGEAKIYRMEAGGDISEMGDYDSINSTIIPGNSSAVYAE